MGRGRNRAQVKGSAGQYARFRGMLSAAWPVLIVLFFSGYLLRAALPDPEISKFAAGFLFLVLAVAMAAAMNAAGSKLADFFKGALGEECVARELAFLPSGFRVFNCVQSGREAMLPSSGDYDHVVVGPTGIYVIETKNWSGTITIDDGLVLYNGQKPDRQPVEQARLAARSLSSRLSEVCGKRVEVKPVLCFAADTFAAGIAGTQGVVVCSLKHLNAVIAEPLERIDSSIQARASEFLNGLLG